MPELRPEKFQVMNIGSFECSEQKFAQSLVPLAICKTPNQNRLYWTIVLPYIQLGYGGQVSIHFFYSKLFHCVVY